MEEGEGWRGKLEEVSACLLCVWGQKISPRVFLASHASSIIGTGEWHSLTDGYIPHLPTSGYFWMIQYPVRIQPVLLIVPFNILLCWPSTPYNSHVILTVKLTDTSPHLPVPLLQRWRDQMASRVAKYLYCTFLALAFECCKLYEDHTCIVHYLLDYRLQDDQITQPSCAAGKTPTS